MHLLFVFAYLCIAWHIAPLIPFSNINNKSISVNNASSIYFFFKQASQAKPGADTKWIGSRSYISKVSQYTWKL